MNLIQINAEILISINVNRSKNFDVDILLVSDRNILKLNAEWMHLLSFFMSWMQF